MPNTTITLPSGQQIIVPLPDDAPTSLPPALLNQIQNTINMAEPREAKLLMQALQSGDFTKFNNYVSREVKTILKEVEAYLTCFCEGTLIRTTRGDVAVEALNVGDVVITASGAAHPIKWLGQQTLTKGMSVDAMPIRIRAGAFGRGLPFADLLLSPGHHICVDMLGEVLVSATRLVNGATIARETVDAVTYWHVELDHHDVLLANGLPTESYLECGNRGFFIGETASPDGAPSYERFCRPPLHDEMLICALRSRLRTRAFDLGWTITEETPRVTIAGVEAELTSHNGVLYAKASIPASSDAEVATKTFKPYHTTNQTDLRDLGLQVCSLIIEGVEVPLEDVAGQGFDAIERDGERRWRWTGAHATLPTALLRLRGHDGAVDVQIGFLNTQLPRWSQPAPTLNPVLRLVA